MNASWTTLAVNITATILRARLSVAVGTGTSLAKTTRTAQVELAYNNVHTHYCMCNLCVYLDFGWSFIGPIINALI
jgi:hypothetical protein